MNTKDHLIKFTRTSNNSVPVSINFKNVRDQITDRLRKEIMTGKFQAGEQLKEIPLSERFQVSRGPIRDAMLQLTLEGLLVSQPNRGARIAQKWDDTLRPLMSEVRFMIERIAAVELLKRESNEEVIVELKRNLRLFELACRDKDMPSVVQLDLDFHRIILRECGHHGLESIWLPLMGGIHLPYDHHRELMESHAEHEAILNAIEAGDEEATVEAIRTNIIPIAMAG